MNEQQRGEVRWIREHDQSRNAVVLVSIIEQQEETIRQAMAKIDKLNDNLRWYAVNSKPV